MFCREQAARFNERLTEFEALGAQVIAIGNGTAPMASDFVERFGVDFAVYTDPRRETYEAAGLIRKLRITTTGLKAAYRALKGGHLQGRTRGDPMQQGGVLVLDADGSQLLFHVDSEAGDHAHVDDVVGAVRQAA